MIQADKSYRYLQSDHLKNDELFQIEHLNIFNST